MITFGAVLTNFTKDCSRCDGTGKEIDAAKIGAEMRKLRRASGKSQERVADRMKISKQHVCAMEKGNRNWTMKQINQYKKAISL